MQYCGMPITGSVSLLMLRGMLISLCMLFAAMAQADRSGISSSKSTLVIPSVVVDGMEKYHFNSADEAVKIWLQPTGEQSQETATTYADTLRDTEKVYGKFIDYHLISVKWLSPSTALVYLVLNYERGPLFVRFVVYEYKSTQLVTQIDFGLVPEVVFPEKFPY